MKHSQIALSNNYSKIAFSGHGQLVFGVIVSLVLLECETVDRIKSALICGDGGGVDYASLHIIKNNANLKDFVGDDNKDFDFPLVSGDALAVVYSGDTFRWEIVSRNDYINLLKEALVRLINNGVILGDDNVMAVDLLVKQLGEMI